MRRMTPEETRSFLITNGRTATIATVRPDGQPHAVPIWYILDGDDVVFTTWHASVKAANLRRDDRAVICIDDAALPLDFVMIEGTVTIVEHPPDLRQWATRIAARYVGENRADEFGARNGVPGEWLMRLHPTKIVARTGVAE